MKGINYMTNENGKKTAVVIDLGMYSEYLEDFLDGIEAEARKNEPKVSFEEVKRNLSFQGKL